MKVVWRVFLPISKCEWIGKFTFNIRWMQISYTWHLYFTARTICSFFFGFATWLTYNSLRYMQWVHVFFVYTLGMPMAEIPCAVKIGVFAFYLVNEILQGLWMYCFLLDKVGISKKQKNKFFKTWKSPIGFSIWQYSQILFAIL